MQKPLDSRLHFTPTAVPQPDDDDEIDLLALVRTLWRGKWWIALFAIVAIGIGGYYAYVRAIPTYTATTQMALQIRQETVVDLESVLSGVSSDQSSINTEMEVIRSRELISALVDRLGLMNDPSSIPRCAQTTALARAMPSIWCGPGSRPPPNPPPHPPRRLSETASSRMSVTPFDPDRTPVLCL